MKSNKNFFKAIFIAAMVVSGACNSSDNSSAPVESVVAGLPNGSSISAPSGSNYMTFTVNGSNCSAATSYPNKPCVSVTICEPGSTTVCQTVNDILLDTGSYGLRVFKSVIPSLVLTPVTSKQGGALTECVKFGDGSADWGSVKLASVTMGGESAVTVPIQVIDSTFGSVPSSCGTPDTSPSEAQFNGILGVGLFPDDCGTNCNGTHTSNGRYFTCTNGNTGYGASGSAASCVGGSSNAITDQVQNPVSALPVDNNGVILQLPSIPIDGATSVTGYMIFGINTESNNVPTGVSRYGTDSDGYISTVYNRSTYDSFLDSGSNGLFFDPSSSLPDCSGSSWLCPSSNQTFNVTNSSIDSSVTSNSSVTIENTDTLFGSPNAAFLDLGGDGGDMFDFGLPFYFGRNVYIGISGTNTSGFGTGPYFAY